VIKGEVHPISCHEDTEGEYRYVSTPSSTSLPNGGGWLTPSPHPLYPLECTGTHCAGEWVGPMAGLDECKKSIMPP